VNTFDLDWSASLEIGSVEAISFLRSTIANESAAVLARIRAAEVLLACAVRSPIPVDAEGE
jgi:hypothetical protein